MTLDPTGTTVRFQPVTATTDRTSDPATPLNVVNLERLSVDLDTAAGTVHALTRSDVDDLRSLAGRLERVAAALDGDERVQLVPYPWS